MARPADDSTDGEVLRLRDENEQLRVSLESALEENGRLTDEGGQLRLRIDVLLQHLRTAEGARLEASGGAQPDPAQDATKEELRVAFEELQVLTEELEATNSGLQLTNKELDQRVSQRTRQLKELDRTLRSTEASLRAVADLVPDLLWRADAHGQADWFNERWVTLTGRRSDQWVGDAWFLALHPQDRSGAQEAWEQAVAEGENFEREVRIGAARGAFRWHIMRARPLRDERGHIVHWFAAAADIHDQRLAMDALQRSELRFRTLVEGMPQLVWRSGEEGRWTWSSPQWSDYTALDEEASRHLGWLNAFHPEDREAAMAAWRRAPDAGHLEIEGRIFHRLEGRYRHFRTRASPVRDASGRLLEWLGTSTDVDDILQLQEKQGVLVAELQHRTRNLMGVVQSVTGRTLRDATSLDQFGKVIADRLSALARVQSLLSRRETSARVAFDVLLREELSAHLDLAECADQVVLEGPAGLPLRSATVQTFALALHELATNAVKYGALSAGGGKLAVTWGVKAGGAVLWVDWRESGVAGIAEGEETRSGYGRELIERALPYQLNARTTYALTADGVHCTVEVDLPSDPVLDRTVG